MPHRTTIRELLDRNRQWAESQTEEDPTYFARHAQGQTPPFLYIDCSDSRVPPTDIVGAGPGDLFVTRNIANLVKPDDVGMRSVLEYGVHVLKVGHHGSRGSTGEAFLAELFDAYRGNVVGLVEYQKAVPGLDIQKYQDQKVRHYRNRCREMGITPDEELIEQILDPEIDFVVGVEAG